MRAATPQVVVNAELLVGLRGQRGSPALIQFCVSVAVAFGISSVLVVSVVQKSREIGILRAVGTPPGRILRVFLIQGGVLGVVGSLVMGIAAMVTDGVVVHRTSAQWMTMRVVFQGLALALIVLTLFN